MSKKLLETQGLTKIFKDDYGDQLLACNSIDLELYRGETLGIVGESGCGKSTLLKLLAQLEKRTSGEIYIDGEEVSSLKGESLRQSRKKLQMVFQDPSSAFFPRMKAGEAISQPLKNFYRLSPSQLEEKVGQMLELVKLPRDYSSRYPHSMSGGQRQRLGIARALILEPEILICDEATSALDVSVQKEIIELLVDIQKKRDLSMIFVCHDIALVQSLSHRIMVMYLGNIVEVLDGDKLQQEVQHPYTKALMDSIITIDTKKTHVVNKLGLESPQQDKRLKGCVFYSRCPYRLEVCGEKSPSLVEVKNHHQVACHLVSNLEA